MNAEIDLIAAAPDELTALRAALASREASRATGIDKPTLPGNRDLQGRQEAKDGPGRPIGCDLRIPFPSRS